MNRCEISEEETTNVMRSFYERLDQSDMQNHAAGIAIEVSSVIHKCTKRGLSSLPPNPNSITYFKQPPRSFTSTTLPAVSSSTPTPNPTSHFLMANDNHHITIPNANEPTKPLVVIHASGTNTIKLTSANYLSWKLQTEALLIGYDLQQFIDGSHPSPAPTVTINNEPIPNPAYNTWLCQDKLIFSALVGSLTPSIVPLIQQAHTSHEAWQILATTYARPSRGHIKQIKDRLKNTTKGSQTISEYMQHIKAYANELATLGKPLDHEDLIEKILDGLDDDYQPIIDAINGRDTPILFDELQEKLINKELSLRSLSTAASPYPTSANPANTRFSSRATHSQSSWSPHRPSTPQQSAINSPFINGPVLNPGPRPPPHWQSHPPPQLQPRANIATATVFETPTWLLDTGASHHVTTDLNNLSIHNPYDGSDDIVMGDGSALPITHTGSTTLSTPSYDFSLHNVLFVPTMKKNLISISQFCKTNHTSIEFLPTSFHVKDLRTGKILLQGRTKDGVYEWPVSSPKSSSLVAFSSIKTTSSQWHHRLGHPSSAILRHIVSNSHLELSSDNDGAVHKFIQLLAERFSLKDLGTLTYFLGVETYEFVDEIKKSLEKACPGVVSCADIIIMASRDAVGTFGGPDWEVKLGRLDSLTTSQADSDNIMPSPRANASSLIELFQKFNLSIKDLVALSGSNSIGNAHCFSIMFKLYNQSEIENQTLLSIQSSDKR
ncbi:hypothetical protein L6164_002554 [Bauhinia variegata]|uniref:Uncharacterized protein n=1 Tax=Bauhinia variegata TaxID=167791 RepID=A0ACB9PY15_BAUVA|nr:hypothetical protein L6164_002554 [Bauhinia variegata]